MKTNEPVDVIDLTGMRADHAARWRKIEEQESIYSAWAATVPRLREERYSRRWTVALMLLCAAIAALLALGWFTKGGAP